MEDSVMDELFGDLGQGQRGSALIHDEDSVDIYSGLDDSPKSDGGSGEESTYVSPKRLKESMDLYEELITEEQNEKDTTYNELKSKFDAAQCQIQELLGNLQQIQTKNSCLHKENTLLKKNICALIKTARLEIVRKDEEISKLSSRHGQSRFCPPRTDRGQEHCLRGQTKNCKGSWGVAESKDDGRLFSQPARLITQADAKPTSFTEQQRHTRNDHHCQSKGTDEKVQGHQRGQFDKASNAKERQNACSESDVMKTRSIFNAGQKVNETAGRPLDCREGVKERVVKQPIDQKMESKAKDIAEKSQRDSTKMTSLSNQCLQQQHEDSVVLRKSSHSKGPFSQTRHVSPSRLHSQTTRETPRVTADMQAQGPSQEVRHNQGEGRHGRSGAHSVSEVSSFEKPATSLDRKIDKRETREHHRKEEKRQDSVGSSERRYTRSDGSKECEQKKTRENDERNRQQRNSSTSSRGERRSTRSEASKTERRSAKESGGCAARETTNKAEKHVKDGRDGSQSDVRNTRQLSSTTKRGDSDREHTRQKDQEDISKRKTSSRTEERLSRSKASSSRDDSRCGKSPYVSHSSSDKHSVKEKHADIDNGRERKRTDKEKQATAEERKLSIAASAGDAKRSTCPQKSRIGNVKDNVNVNIHSTFVLTSSYGISAVEEESSPKRKLTFMETLNLTLSPIKKQSPPDEANEPTAQPFKDALADNLGEERRSFELGENFCVIDETEQSQESVEAMDDACTQLDSTPATGDEVHTEPSIEPSNFDIQPSQDQDQTPCSKEPKTGLQDINLKEQVGGGNEEIGEGAASFLKGTDTDTDTPHGEKDSITVADDSVVSAAGISGNNIAPSVTVAVEACAPIYALCPPLVEDVCKEKDPQTSTNKHEQRSRVNSNDKDQIDNQPEPQDPAPIQSHAPQEEVSTTEVPPISETCSNPEALVSLETVSSTVGLDVTLKSKQSVSDLEIKKGLEKTNSGSRPLEGTHTGSVNTSSTVEGTQASSSQPDSTEDDLQTTKPSTSVVLPQDEDSMMLTLNSIKVIPNAISPLTSPVRQKRIQPHCPGKEPQVKSLCRDLSTSTVVTNKEAIKRDMNKENKRPDCPVLPSVVKDQEILSSTATEDEPEEGEITTSDDESSLSPATKSPSGIRPSPTSARLENRKKRPTGTLEKERNSTDSSKESPTSNKRRFKTITVPPKANVSTSAEFMNMFLFIRSELRKKYMKLHKHVTKSAFCCIVDMSLASFTEFVDSVNFQKFCSQGNEIKPRLNKIISSVMSKVSSNGIVNRIFEQQADDLKQKLWNFVDGQFDFLFKELKAAVKGVSGLSNSTSTHESKHSNTGVKEAADVSKDQAKKPLSTAEHRPNNRDKAEVQRTTHVPTLPCLRGLGSRGKNIKATMEEEAPLSGIQPTDKPSISSLEKSLQENVSAPEIKTSTCARRLSHTGSTHDRTDFEILTEQQTSSLTFNLVTDSQMGDIFRCLLQGSDLLEAGISAGDNQSWPINTPRKEGPAGESVIGVVTPSKIMTPSKLVAAWSASPYKLSSPSSKIQMPLNPALFDESCLLEVPSGLPNQAAPALSSQQSFSILAEDLAVSLTVPSPLKSDGHLSFLPPASGQPMSAPSSVISAHFSEDALVDGEDATEQDIHLSLDTDNSSCESSTCETWGHTGPAAFQFKPNLPMQAEVMERSNDHFIVRIKHKSTGAHDESRQELKDTVSAVDASAVCQEDKNTVSHVSQHNGSLLNAQTKVTTKQKPESQMSSKDASSGSGFQQETPARLLKTTVSPAVQANADAADADTSLSPGATGHTVISSKKEGASDTDNTNQKISRKRRKHHSGPKAKQSRTEKQQDKCEESKQRHKKMSKSCKEKGKKTSSKKGNESPQLSPSLSAKNVIRKKGEVVVTWTREEDRDILVHLKTKGASPKTFAALSSKLNKSPAQIEERFSQLMKLFKKKEKMEN